MDTEFIPQLYIRSPHCPPPKASNEVEIALVIFQEHLSKEQKEFNKKSRPNITNLQTFALRNLAKDEKFITIWADKNMGVVVMTRETYIKQCIQEHLGDKQVYENITDNYKEKIEEINSKFDDFTTKNKRVLGQQALTFFEHSHEIHGDNVARF